MLCTLAAKLFLLILAQDSFYFLSGFRIILVTVHIIYQTVIDVWLFALHFSQNSPTFATRICLNKFVLRLLKLEHLNRDALIFVELDIRRLSSH